MLAPLMRNEVNRKIIHLCSLWMPCAVYYLPSRFSFLLFSFLVLCSLSAEYLRHRSVKIELLLERLFSASLRESERGVGMKITGASYMLIGALFSLLFAREISVTALSVLMISDTAAALVGMTMGKNRYMGKSLEGCAAFLLSALLVLIVLGCIMPHTPDYFSAGIAAIVMATMAEVFSRKLHLDDNLTIPVVICVTMWMLI